MTDRRLALIAALASCALAAGCAGHGRHTSEGVARATERLAGFKAGADWDMASQQFLAGDLAKALKTIERSIAMSGSVAKSHTLRGRILLELGRLEDSLEALRAAHAIDPDFVEAWWWEGVVLERLNEHEPALACYAEAAARDDSNPQYTLAAAEMLIELGRLDEAAHILETSRATFRYNAAIRQTLGHIALMRDEPARAVGLFNEARLLAQDDDELTIEYVNALIADRQFVEADAHLARLLAKPDLAERRDLQHLRARCLVELDRPSEARSVLIGLTRGSEGASDAAAWIALGRVAIDLNDYQRVRICASRAVALSPDQPEPHMLVAAWRMQAGDLEAALRAAGQAETVAGPDPEPSILRGVLLMELGRESEAADAFASALQRDPASAHAASLLASVEAGL